MTLAAAPQTIAGYYDTDAGKVQTGERMKMAMNLGWPHNWNTCNAFLNMVKSSQVGEYDGQYFDNTSTAISYWVHNGVVRDFPEGTYVMTWDTAVQGQGECVLAIAGTAPITETADSIANTGNAFYPDVNRKEFETSAGTGFDTFGPQASIGPQVTNIAFYDKAYETEFLAGRHIHPDFITDISINDIIRVKDWMQGDGCQWTTYAGYPTTDWVSWVRGVPVEVLCEIANETGGELFACIPHKFNSADRILMATDFFNGLTTKKISVEWGNETWNSANPWADEFWWALLIDEIKHTAIYSGANGLFDEVAHGLNVGDLIRTFSSDTEPSSGAIASPWITGGAMRVTEVPDANSFKVGLWGNGGWNAAETGTNTGASGQTTTLDDSTKSWTTNQWVGFSVFNETDGSGGIVTSNTSNQLTFSAGLSGGTDNDFDAGDAYSMLETDIPNSTFVTFFYCFDPLNSSGPSGPNTAEQTALCWDDFDSVFGRANTGHMAGTWMRGEDFTASQLLTPEFRAGLDLIVCAMYYEWKPVPDPITITALTDNEIRDLGITSLDSALTDDYLVQIATAGHTRYAFYEGGQIYTDSITVAGNDSATNDNKIRMVAFIETPQYEELVRLWAQRNLSLQGAAWMCWFYSHSTNTQPYPGAISMQGVQSARGLRTELGYTLWADWAVAGGVPKP